MAEKSRPSFMKRIMRGTLAAKLGVFGPPLVILAVGFAYSAQEVNAVPRERTDQPLDAVITERDTVYPR